MFVKRRSNLLLFGSLIVFALAAHFAPSTALAQVSAADLEEMLGPIALYPDELLANVLAASMYPDDVKAAGKYVADGGDAAKLGEKGWEPPVVAVARIPELIKMMNENLDWTQALGEAYVVQAEDVMTAVQTLRAKAKANGALVSNEQQTVVEDGSTIIIQPAQPEVIYVPQYSPQVVYVDSGPSAGDVALGMAMVFGTALMMDAIFDDNMGCYWGGGGYVGYGHPPYYGGGYHGGNNDININVNNNVNNINIDNDKIKTDGSRGRDGQKFEPNSKKVDTNAIRSGQTKSLNNYKGVSNRAASGAGGKVPGGTGPARPATADNNRTGPGGAGQQANRANASQQDAQRAGASQQDAKRPSAAQQDAKRPDANRPSASHQADASARSTAKESSRPSAPKASSSDAMTSSGFRPNSGDAKASARGQSSRSPSGGGSSSRGGGGGGGGSRGGGGGGGRGR